MPTLNEWFGIGRIGKDDPKLTIKSAEKRYAKFSLAIDQGKGQETMWLQITCWDKLAENIAKYARSGMLVFVQGKLQIRKYRDSHQVEKWSVEIIATVVQLLEKRKADDEIPDEVLPEA